MNTFKIENEAIEIHGATFGPFQTNHYILVEKSSRKGWLFDCGTEGTEILEWLRSLNVQLQYIWLTHGHIDHVASVDTVARVTDVGFAMHEADLPFLTDLEAHARMFGLRASNVRKPDAPIAIGRHTIGGLDCDIRYVPGHSPGSVVFYFPDLNTVIAGDTLFAYSIGRTDLPGGNHQQLLEAIRSQLFTLPDDTIVLPGHMGPTTVGREKQHNPFL